MQKTRFRLGKILQQLGYITEQQLEEALQIQQSSYELIGAILMRLGYITSDQLAQAQAYQFGVDYEEVRLNDISQEVKRLIPAHLAAICECFPCARSGIAWWSP